MELIAENLSRQYFRKNRESNIFSAVHPLSLTLRSGEAVLIRGRSGSGKTTLLHMLAGLLTPSEGRVVLDGTDLYALPDDTLSRLRAEKIGLIPQGRSAVETLTVRENLLLPGWISGKAVPDSDAETWMELLGITDLRDAMPADLSGGELRRLAIARTMLTDPAVILADEPTGDLDNENTLLVLDTLRQAARAGKIVVIVSHEEGAASWADRCFRMNAGEISEE